MTYSNRISSKVTHNASLGTNDQKNAKYAMKNLYKLQLDEVMNEKTKIKERQKEQANHEKV